MIPCGQPPGPRLAARGRSCRESPVAGQCRRPIMGNSRSMHAIRRCTPMFEPQAEHDRTPSPQPASLRSPAVLLATGLGAGLVAPAPGTIGAAIGFTRWPGESAICPAFRWQLAAIAAPHRRRHPPLHRRRPRAGRQEGQPGHHLGRNRHRCRSSFSLVPLDAIG